MTEGTHANILRRMAGMQVGGDAQSPLTSSRAVRLVLAKVAQDSVGLPLAVSSVAEDVADLDATLAALPDGLMLVRLERADQTVGLMGLDMQLRAAVLEVTTTGKLLAQVAEDRPPTGTDRFLCDALIKGFLDSFPEAVRATAFEGWAQDTAAGELFADTRLAGLILAPNRYRTVQMTVQLGQTDRQGLLLLALPLPEPDPVEGLPKPEAIAWEPAFTAAVTAAPVSLAARLHNFRLTLAEARPLKVGAVLPLGGCTVSSARLCTTDGRLVARGRLGQSGGMRALRIEAPPALDMRDLPMTPSAEMPMVAMSDVAETAMLDMENAGGFAGVAELPEGGF